MEKKKIVQVASDEYFTISNLAKYLLHNKDFKKQRDMISSKSATANLVKTYTLNHGDLSTNEDRDCKYN